MSDPYWRYESRQQPAMAATPVAGKRPRSEYDAVGGGIGGHEYAGYLPQDDRTAPRIVRDNDAIGASYDRYLRNGQVPQYGAGDTPTMGGGGALGRTSASGMAPVPVDDLIRGGGVDAAMAAKGRNMGFGGGRPEAYLPPDATNTLFVEGLPSNCSRREVSHIFRPFVGYKEVRLVNKESRIPGGDQLVLCFVDFTSPSHAAVALDALQGYRFDENDRDSANLRLQFARYPGPRSGGGSRGRR